MGRSLQCLQTTRPKHRQCKAAARQNSSRGQGPMQNTPGVVSTLAYTRLGALHSETIEVISKRLSPTALNSDKRENELAAAVGVFDVAQAT